MLAPLETPFNGSTLQAAWPTSKKYFYGRSSDFVLSFAESTI